MEHKGTDGIRGTHENAGQPGIDTHTHTLIESHSGYDCCGFLNLHWTIVHTTVHTHIRTKAQQMKECPFSGAGVAYSSSLSYRDTRLATDIVV